jgi:UDP-N-acetylglucosamine 1-carboxyvinyltransferase
LNQYIIHGGKPLYGSVNISGAKNAAVAIIPAALMVDGCCRVENIPQISDVTLFLSIMEELGAKVRVCNAHTMEFNCHAIRSTQPSYDMARRIRASYYLIGALLGRFGEATVAMPGGCNFGGVRPIDQHIKGFTAMGAEVSIDGGFIHAKAKGGRLKGAPVYLDMVSVGATMNIMMAAVLAEGTTTIENAAREPHIVDLANFLNSMGADIKGAGTDTIKVHGVETLGGGSYTIIPDQIEAGTYMAAVAAAGGQVLIRNIIPKHMDCITAKLVEMGVEVEEQGDSLLVTRTGALHKTNVKTLPYPGFPTDMQPQISTVLALAEGTSMVTEGVWSNRFRYVDELKRMGANIQVDGKVAVIEGIDHFVAAPIQACDLRAGAALVIAGLAAHGETEVTHVQYIERGYEDLVGKLCAIGADIRIEDIPSEEDKADAHIS